MVYYVAVIAWTLFFFINAFYPTLPWSACDNWWNTETCIVPKRRNYTVTNVTAAAVPTTTLSFTTMPTGNTTDAKTSAEEFWQYYVLRKTDDLEEVGSVQPHLVACLFVSWLLVFLCLIKGVKSLGKVVYVTALMPYILLTTLLVRGLMLPGSVDGIWFYVYPEFSTLTNLSVWIEAAIQVFFSLGPAWGSLITMSSFNRFNNNCFSGFIVFSVVGFMAKEANVTVPEVATEGPGLALVAYPEAITKLPLPQLWAVLFFLMLLMLGLDSQFGMCENLLAGIMDAFPYQLRRRRVMVTAVVAFISFLLGLPLTLNGGIYIFQLMDWFTSAFCLFISSFLECIVIGWIYGVERFGSDIELMLGQRPGVIMKFCWCISAPLIILTVFIATVTSYKMPVYDGYVYPTIARVVGFMFSIISILPIPLFMVWELSKAKGSLWQRLIHTLKPDEKWGPSLQKHRETYRNDNHQFKMPFRDTLLSQNQMKT